jgi:hypothetical protein
MKEIIMAEATCVAKTLVLAKLRARNLHERAAWVDKQLPVLIDTATNASLMQTLGIDVDTLIAEGRSASAAADPEHSQSSAPSPSTD